MTVTPCRVMASQGEHYRMGHEKVKDVQEVTVPGDPKPEVLAEGLIAFKLTNANGTLVAFNCALTVDVLRKVLDKAEANGHARLIEISGDYLLFGAVGDYSDYNG